VFPLWRGTKGEESFVSDERFGFPPLEELKLRCFTLLEGEESFGWGERLVSPSGGAEDELFPPLEGDKGGGFFYIKRKKS